jgi:hypothetical protein
MRARTPAVIGAENEVPPTNRYAVQLMWDAGLSLEGAAESLDGNGTSRSGVKRAVASAQRYARRIMQDRLRDETGEAPEGHEIVREYSRLCARRRK